MRQKHEEGGGCSGKVPQIPATPAPCRPGSMVLRETLQPSLVLLKGLLTSAFVARRDNGEICPRYISVPCMVTVLGGKGGETWSSSEGNRVSAAPLHFLVVLKFGMEPGLTPEKQCSL